MSKVKNIISVVVMSAIATLSLTVGASALTQSVDSETSGKDLIKTSNGFWYGVFPQNNLSLFGDEFSECEHSTIKISNGYNAELNGDVGYSGMWRTLSIVVVGKTTNSDYVQGSYSPLKVSTREPNNATSITCMAENFDGTEPGSKFQDGYLIVVNKE